MRIAFYAPLKPPTHPVPSGDRRMALSLMEAMRQSGHIVELACRFRSYDGGGNAARQARLCRIGQGLAARLLNRYEAGEPERRPQLWFTYHLYHRAPDWLGPAISRGLDIPYIAAEASFAGKQEGGRWAAGHRAAAAAIEAADMIVNFNPIDAAGVRRLHGDDRRMIALPPFIEAAPFQAAASRHRDRRDAIGKRFDLASDPPRFLTVAMMRPGDKLESFRLLGLALRQLLDLPWQLLVIGEGPARAIVEEYLSGLGPDRVRFGGEQPQEAMPDIYAGCDLYVWPAIGEAYGMSFLEAQAAGLPAIAGDNHGVGEVVDGKAGALVPAGDVDAFAAALRRLATAPREWPERRAAAQAFVANRRSLAAARAVLDAAMARAVARRRR